MIRYEENQMMVLLYSQEKEYSDQSSSTKTEGLGQIEYYQFLIINSVKNY